MVRDYQAEYRRRTEKARRDGYQSFYMKRLNGTDWFRRPPDGTRIQFPDGQVWERCDGTWQLLRDAS